MTVPEDARDAAPSVRLIIDARGRKCPIPVIILAERICEVNRGDAVEVLADDPAARTDLSGWCHLARHDLLRLDENPDGYSFLVRRRH